VANAQDDDITLRQRFEPRTYYLQSEDVVFMEEGALF
jgi:hypothetical protein